MGIWGMGMTQSDEFCETYERFMERYNVGDDVSTITADILAGYLAEFSADDGILHDVYFALAKAEWMCCAQSPEILGRVREIIESGANIDFYRELEATEADLKIRQKNLNKFWASLQTPRAKPRQRRIDPLDRIKELPPIQPGECYAYKHGDGYRALVVLDRFKDEGWLEQVCCCILRRTFDSPKVQVTEEEIGCITTYVGLEFLAKSNLKKIGCISLPHGLCKRLPWGLVTWFGSKKSFHREIDNPLGLTLAELLDPEK